MRNDSPYFERGHGLKTRRYDVNLLRSNIKVDEDRRSVFKWLQEHKGPIDPEWWKELLDCYDYNYTEINNYLQTLCPYCLFNDSTSVGNGVRLCNNCQAAIP
jgi:hypothetical protein